MKILCLAALGTLVLVPTAHAAPVNPATTHFNVTIQILNECLVSTPATIDLGQYGATELISATASNSQNYTVNCSKGTTYTITFVGADDLTVGGATHQMKGTTTNTDVVQYNLFDGTNTTPLDATHTVTGTGTGLPVTNSVKAQVVNYAASVKPDIYTDTVTMSVAY